MNKLHGTNTFKLAAGRLQDLRLFLHKDEMQSLDILSKTRSYAESILGDDIKILDVRRDSFGYLMNKMGKYFFYLIDGTSSVALDHEHMLVVLNKYRYSPVSNRKKAEIPPEVTFREFLAFAYYYGGKQLAEEFEEIKKTAIKSYISPAFDLNPQTYKWKRCPHVLRQYMLYFTRPPGYNVYQFEYPNLASICYLQHKGLTFSEAESYVSFAKAGLFYTFLPIDVENRLLYDIAGNRFKHMDGDLAKNYVKDRVKFASKFTLSDSSIFSVFVKPLMIEKTGQMMLIVQNSLDNNALSSNTDVYFYHVSPYRFGLAIKDTLDINEVLPRYADRQNNELKYLKPVGRPNISSLISGVHL